MSADPDDVSAGAPDACTGGAITVSESTASAISTENPVPASTAATMMRRISRAAETRDTLTTLPFDRVFMLASDVRMCVIARESLEACIGAAAGRCHGKSRAKCGNKMAFLAPAPTARCFRYSAATASQSQNKGEQLHMARRIAIVED